MRLQPHHTLALVILLTAPSLAQADTAGIEFFEKKVRPVLADHCYSCHSAKVKGGLRLDSRSALLRGGDSGTALAPGQPEKSLVIQVLHHAEDQVKMPPKGKLPATLIADLTQWVKMGAPWPDEGSSATDGPTTNRTTAAKHWAWQPLRAARPPQVSTESWPTQVIDRFILAGLEARGLKPAPAAADLTLVRRLYFDLIGLPPTPEEIDAFLEESANGQLRAALEKVVNRLLASPHFGERWGRHWLDVARYADSCGSGANMVFDDAWRYRDYVIEAFNADKPYDRFVIEQLAGDLLPAATEDQRRAQLVATGFLMLGPKELAEYDKEKMRLDIVDEQLDAVGQVFLGLTLGCARCHDHKFDPVPTRDYYALAGIFRSTATVARQNSGGPISSLLRRPLAVAPAAASEARAVGDRLKQVQAQLAQARAALKKLPPGKPAAGQEAVQTRIQLLGAEAADLQTRLEGLTAYALAVADEAQPVDLPILIRGDLNNRGAVVPRGFLSVAFPPSTDRIAAKQSGRLELARWLIAQPTTPRVIVNRVWHWLFGAGLVRTVDNFGVRGETPSHPELLDYLAARFVEHGWSIKRLVREIVLSRTYQQSGVCNPDAAKVDPENRLLWRHSRRRLEAEEIRDAVLAVSGQLDCRMGGSTHTYRGRLGAEGMGTSVTADPRLRRSVYLAIYRGGYAPDLFQAFDFPDSGLVTGRRNVTTVPTQALYLLNSPFVKEQGRQTAERLLKHPGQDAERAQALYRHLLGRLPAETEQARALAFLADYRRAWSGRDVGPDVAAWSALCQALTASNEFLFVE